jgi:outer membrane protein assembly factor BamB
MTIQAASPRPRRERVRRFFTTQWQSMTDAAAILTMVLVTLGPGASLSCGEDAQDTTETGRADSIARVRPESDDWPCWRGPAGNNHSADLDPPVHWSASNNIRWKVEVPGRGHASPCVVGDKIYLASANEPENAQSLICLDRQNGTLLWQTELHRGSLPTIHNLNSHASATPACDGSVIVTLFVNADQLWASGVEIDGTLRWQTPVSAFRHSNGYGSSPALYGNLVIVSSDNQEEPCLVALRRSDGHVVWKIPRPNSDNSASPLVAEVAGRPQLLLNGAKAVMSFDPATGEEIWHVNHDTDIAANTMTFDKDCVYASGNVPEKLVIAIRADGQGDVSESHVLWRVNRDNPYVPSPLVCGDLLFALLDAGTVTCREAHSGEEIWKERLGGTFFASPVAANGNVYAVNDAGVMFVFRAARDYELVATNDIGEPCVATPVICGGSIYLRTEHHLICIGTDERSVGMKSDG